MAIDFPDSPTTGDTFTAGNRTWEWSGSAWEILKTAIYPIQKTIVDAKGDLITATADDTPARLGIGADDSVLIANSAQASGLEWSSELDLSRLTVSGDAIFDTNTLYVDANDNRVGVGTTNPQSALDVNGTAFIRSKMLVGGYIFAQEPWSPTTIALGNYGSVGTQGSYRTSLAWNYERGTDSGFYSLGVNSYTSAASVDLGNDGIMFRTDANYAATTIPTERMRIDTSGKVGIGTTSPAHPLHVTGSDNRPIRAESSVSGSYIDIQDSATTGEGYVAIGAVGNDAKIIAGGTTRMTINSSGNVGIGDASNSGSFQVYATQGAYSFVVTDDLVYSANIADKTTASGANVYVDSSNKILYRSTSSSKYKTDIETLDNQHADIVYRLRPVWYRSTTGNDPEEWSYYGLIAEEVAEIDPRLVHFGNAPDCGCVADEEGRVEHALSCKTEPEGVQYERLVPHLISVVQRQKEQIDALESRITALESKLLDLSNPPA